MFCLCFRLDNVIAVANSLILYEYCVKCTINLSVNDRVDNQFIRRIRVKIVRVCVRENCQILWSGLECR